MPMTTKKGTRFHRGFFFLSQRTPFFHSCRTTRCSVQIVRVGLAPLWVCSGEGALRDHRYKKNNSLCDVLTERQEGIQNASCREIYDAFSERVSPLSPLMSILTPTLMSILTKKSSPLIGILTKNLYRIREKYTSQERDCAFALPYGTRRSYGTRPNNTLPKTP